MEDKRELAKQLKAIRVKELISIYAQSLDIGIDKMTLLRMDKDEYPTPLRMHTLKKVLKYLTKYYMDNNIPSRLEERKLEI
jgi:hypothetical protein